LKISKKIKKRHFWDTLIYRRRRYKESNPPAYTQGCNVIHILHNTILQTTLIFYILMYQKPQMLYLSMGGAKLGSSGQGSSSRPLNVNAAPSAKDFKQYPP